MKKKILKISIPLLLIFTILYIGFVEYNKVVSLSNNPLSTIPTNASIIIEINNIDQLNKGVKKRDVWKKLRNFKIIRSFEEHLEIIDILLSNLNIFYKESVILSVHRTGIEESGVLFVASKKKKLDEELNLWINEVLFDIDNNHSKKILADYDGATLWEINCILNNDSLENKSFFYCSTDDLFILSNKRLLLEDAIRQSKNKINILNTLEFKQVYETTRRNATVNIFYNFNNIVDLLSIYLKEKINPVFNNFLNWTGGEMIISNHSIIANGFSYTSEEMKNYTDILVNSNNQKSEIQNYVPKTTHMLTGLTFDNPKDIFRNKNNFLANNHALWEWNKYKKDINNKYNFDYDEFIDQIDTEVGLFYCSSSNIREIGYIKVKSSVLAIAQLQSLFDKNQIKKHQGFTINKLQEDNLTGNLFGSIFDIKNSNFVTNIDDYLFFSDSPSNLEYLIDYYNTSDVLFNSPNFQNYIKSVNENNNFTFYINPGKINELLAKTINNTWKQDIDSDSITEFTGLSLQLSMRNGYLMNNLILYQDQNYEEDLKEIWSIQTDTIFETKPQIIYNHFTKKEDVLIQDLSNTIYLFNSEGKLIWRKKLKEKILGKVSQIDYYKNNKLQVLFNTKNSIHVIDRLGNYVKGYPIKTPAETSLPHSLFDYDKNKNYRIFIAGINNDIYNLNKKGDKVRGWKYKKNGDTLLSKIVHFSKDNKDYILVNSDKKIRLLARNGSDRLSFSSDEIIDYELQLCDNGDIISKTKEGKLWIGKLKSGMNSEISISNLSSKSILHISDKLNWKLFENEMSKTKIIFSNAKDLYITNRKYQEIFTKSFLSDIISIGSLIYNSKGYLYIQTKEGVYLINEGLTVLGTPIAIEKLFCITDLDKDNEINILVGKGNILYNYEISNLD